MLNIIPLLSTVETVSESTGGCCVWTRLLNLFLIKHNYLLQDIQAWVISSDSWEGMCIFLFCFCCSSLCLGLNLSRSPNFLDKQKGMYLGYILKSIIYPDEKNSRKNNLERFLQWKWNNQHRNMRKKLHPLNTSRLMNDMMAAYSSWKFYTWLKLYLV